MSDVADLRRLIAEPTEDTYTNEDLTARIAAAGSDIASVAADIWREKAARYAELVDVSEAGSSRAMGSLYKQALDMAEKFDTSDIGTQRKTRIRSIERT